MMGPGSVRVGWTEGEGVLCAEAVKRVFGGGKGGAEALRGEKEAQSIPMTRAMIYFMCTRPASR